MIFNTVHVQPYILHYVQYNYVLFVELTNDYLTGETPNWHIQKFSISRIVVEY
jgi:hypothetical protein